MLILYFICRTKPPGWFGVTGICAFVLPQRKVWHSYLLIWLPEANFAFTYWEQHKYMFWSLRYLIFVFSLPWQNLKAATKKQKYDKICEKKVSTPIEVSICTYIYSECIFFFVIITILFVCCFCVGFMQISSCRVCFILPLLPFFDLWSATWLWILEAPISGVICSRRWL